MKVTFKSYNGKTLIFDDIKYPGQFICYILNSCEHDIFHNYGKDIRRKLIRSKDRVGEINKKGRKYSVTITTINGTKKAVKAYIGN